MHMQFVCIRWRAYRNIRGSPPYLCLPLENATVLYKPNYKHTRDTHTIYKEHWIIFWNSLDQGISSAWSMRLTHRQDYMTYCADSFSDTVKCFCGALVDNITYFCVPTFRYLNCFSALIFPRKCPMTPFFMLHLKCTGKYVSKQACVNCINLLKWWIYSFSVHSCIGDQVLIYHLTVGLSFVLNSLLCQSVGRF